MSEPFIAEVRMVGFNFAPRGWAFCDGQILPINQNQSLYSLIGTTYGGDGRTSFALPDLRGRTPMHVSSARQEGAKGGEATHSLTVEEIPAHSHDVMASSDNATSNEPGGRSYGNARERSYANYDAAQKVALANNILATTGTGQGHQNMQPYLAVNFCIAMQGLFPSRN